MAESVALVFALRDSADDGPFSGMPRLDLAGLPPQHARELLSAAIPGPIDERVRDRILAETRGNPLALLELPQDLSYAELAGGFGLPDAQQLTHRIEDTFQRRLAPLPSDTRRLLLVAAVEPAGDAALVRRAAQRLGIAVDASIRRSSPAWSVPRADHLPASAGALGDPSRGDAGGTLGGAPRAGRGHRSGARRRPPRLAPRPRGEWPRRRRRRGTGTVRRPRPGPRRPGRGRRLPRTLRTADASIRRSGPPGRWRRRRPRAGPGRSMRRWTCW